MRLPGDPELVRVAARALAMAATEADSTRTGIGRADGALTGGGDAWSGEAADQFSATVLGNASALQAYAGACGKASQTLTIYADDLAAAHAAAERANALADLAGATLDNEGLIAEVRPEISAPVMASDRSADLAAAQNAGREALMDFRNAARRAVAGLHDARHELMPQYSVSAPNGFNYADWALGLYTAGVAVSGAPEYRALMKSSRRRAYYWDRKVGETRGHRLAKLLADRAAARAARFARTARAAEHLAGLRFAPELAREMKTVPGGAAVPVLRRLPVAGVGFAVGGTALEVRQGAEPVAAIGGMVGSLAAGAVATQFVAAGLVALGMAGAAPIVLGALAGAAVAWGVGEGIKWLSNTRAGQDAIAGAKELAGDVGETIGNAAKSVGSGWGKVGGRLGFLLR